MDAIETTAQTGRRQPDRSESSGWREKADHGLEWSLVGLYGAILIFGPLGLGAVTNGAFLVILWLTVLALGLWGVRWWVAASPRLLWPPFCWGVVLFLGYVAARAGVAPVAYEARQELLRVAVYAVLTLLAVNNFGRRRTMHVLIGGLLLLGTGLGMFAVYQFLTGSQQIWFWTRPPGYGVRGSGTYFCPNHLAGCLEMILPLGLAYTGLSRGPILRRILCGYASLVMSVGLAMTISRAGWLAAGVGLLWFFGLVLRASKRGWFGLGLAVVLVAGGWWMLSHPGLVYQRTARVRQPLNDGVRQLLYESATRMWLDHPWFGIGPAQFDTQYRLYRQNLWQTQASPVFVHNDYLNLLVDYGVVGMILVAACWGAVAWGAVRNWRALGRWRAEASERSRDVAMLMIGATAGLVALLVHSFFDFNLHIPANAILAVTLLGLISGLLRRVSGAYWLEGGWPLRLGFTLLLVAGLGWLSYQGWRTTQEEVWLRRAARSRLGSPERREALERAFRIDPWNGGTAYVLGEEWRLASWRGQEGYQELAEQAISWFTRVAKLKPSDPFSRGRIGRCLDWVGRNDEAEKWFMEALRLDPNGTGTLANLAWHSVQVENWKKAKEFADRSLWLDYRGELARSCLETAELKLREAAATARPPVAPTQGK